MRQSLLQRTLKLKLTVKINKNIPNSYLMRLSFCFVNPSCHSINEETLKDTFKIPLDCRYGGI